MLEMIRNVVVCRNWVEACCNVMHLRLLPNCSMDIKLLQAAGVISLE